MSLYRFCPMVEQLGDRRLPTTYAFAELATLGGNYSLATDVNAAGVAVGVADTANGLSHAVLWANGMVIDLGTLGGQSSRAEAINDHGQVTGQAQLSSGAYRAFRLTPEDTDGDAKPDRWFRNLDADGDNDLMTPLNPIRGKTQSSGFDINAAGDVAGSSGDAWEGYRATTWTGSSGMDVGTLGGTSSYATGINDAGQVIGSAKNTAGRSRPFLWSSRNGMTDLGQGTYFIGTAESITASGRVTYRGWNSVTGNYRSTFVWTPNRPNGTTGGYVQLSALPPYDELAYGADINDAGWTVGTSAYFVSPYDPESGDSGYYVYRAVVWENGVPAELNPLIAGSSGQGIDSPTGVNLSGQIVGNQALATGYYRAVLLTPHAGPHAIRIGDVTAVETNSGNVACNFTITLSGASADPVTVSFATADGTATVDNDYQSSSGTLTFAPGETEKTISVPLNGDRLAEPNETFFVNLSSPTNANIADGQVTGTIIDDEPRISVSDLAKKEGKKNQTTLFTFTVTLSAAYDQPVTVSFQTVNGTAKTSDDDYVAKTGTLTFAPGETTKTITIEVKGDTKKEADETFYLDLFGNSSNSLLAKSCGIGTILNDD